MSTSPSVLLPRPPASGVPSTAFVGPVWEGVAQLVDRVRRLDDLREHGLQLIAAARLTERGQEVPPALKDEVREARLAALAVPLLLARVRKACSGPVVLFKGPEAAACYPGAALRPYIDVDILVPNAYTALEELLSSGFVHVGDDRDYTGEHHRRPLAHPDIPISLEVHARPKWVAGLREPSPDFVFRSAVSSAVEVPGVTAPAPAVHAVLLAAHAWAERPLGRLADLVDVAVVNSVAPAGQAAALADEVGLGRIWQATVAAADAVFQGRRATWPLRTWARNLSDGRGRSVLESHLSRILAPFSTLPPRRAVPAAGRATLQTLQPAEAERWRTKLARSRLALRNASMRRWEHERHLQDDVEDGQ